MPGESTKGQEQTRAEVAEEERAAEAYIHGLAERAYHDLGMSADKARSWAEGQYSKSLSE